MPAGCERFNFRFCQNHEAHGGASSCHRGSAATTGASLPYRRAVFQPNYARFTLVRRSREAYPAEHHTSVRPVRPIGVVPEADTSPRSVTPDLFFTPVADVTTSTTLLVNPIPSDGTNTKINSRRAGAPTVFTAGRPLSIGRPVQARRMHEETRVLPVLGGIRFGVRPYRTATQARLGCSAVAVPTAPVGAVDR